MRADAIIAEEAGTSRNQVQRYIRLNNLIKPILNMVDSEKIAFIHTKGLDLSRFMLGTVQLGMEYGLGSDRAKPSYQKAFAIRVQKMLTRKEAAKFLGISLATLDAARNNGLISYIQYVENGCVYFSEANLQEYIARSTHRANPRNENSIIYRKRRV